MWTPSRGLGSGRRAGLRRIADYLGDDHTEASDSESFITGHSDELLASTSGAGGGVGMLPEFLADQSDLVEVMLELDEESMVVRSVTPTAGVPHGPEALLTGGGMHTPGGSGRSLSRSSSTSSRIRRMFAWLRSPSPLPVPAAAPDQPRQEAAMAARERRRVQARVNRSRSGARRALKGLRFISRATGSAEATAVWGSVEERFNALSRDGLLARDDFGDCIGMVDSREFAVGVFDALARRRRLNLERISKDELHEFWLQISDRSFDARLQIFFDMVDTNVDGRITKEEVQEASKRGDHVLYRPDRSERVGEQAVEAQGAGGGVRAAHHGGARPGGSGLHRAVAAGGAPPAARRLHELQPAAQQRQRQHGAVEPEHRRRRRAEGAAAAASGGGGTGPPEEVVAKMEPAERGVQGARDGGGGLAARVGAGAVGRGDGGAVRVEVRAVPPVGGVRGGGVLPADGQGRRRDAQAQHGAGAPPRLPHHAHLAPLLLGTLLRPLRRQHRLPQDHSDGDRDGHLPARGEPSGVRLPTADRIGAGGVPAAGGLLRGEEADVQAPHVRRGGRHRDCDGGAHGRVIHPGGAPAAKGGVHPAAPPAPARPPRRVQRLLVLAPPARRRLPPAARPRLVHVPRQ